MRVVTTKRALLLPAEALLVNEQLGGWGGGIAAVPPWAVWRSHTKSPTVYFVMSNLHQCLSLKHWSLTSARNMSLSHICLSTAATLAVPLVNAGSSGGVRP
jgi:hypothetical protein